MRPSKEIGLMAALPEPADLSQRIIENYRLHSQPVRKDYLEYLAQKSHTYSCEMETLQEGQPAYDVDQSTRSMVDRIFNILEVYTLQLNKMSRMRDFYVSATEPARVVEVQEYNRFRQPLKSLTVYRARFSTQKLSLSVRGMGNHVEFFLLPGDRVMGLSRAEAEVGALMVFQSEATMTGLSWFVEAKPLIPDRLERYSLLALEHLLDKTREEVGYTY